MKCKLALEKCAIDQSLILELDKGEPQFMVQNSLKKMGYKFTIIYEEQKWIRLLITHDLS